MRKLAYIFAAVVLCCVSSCGKDRFITDIPEDVNYSSGSGREAEAKGKKGIGFSKNAPNWAARVAGLKCHWYYNWGSEDVTDEISGAEFVPMIWGKASDQQLVEKCEAINELYRAGKCFSVLGFNEPDLAAESNLTVAEAVRMWKVIDATLLPQIRRVSPCPSYPTRQWLFDFIAECDRQGLRVDHIAVHIYAGTGRANYANAIREAYTKCGNRPVWVTEFAPRDDNASKNGYNSYLMDQTVLPFMKDVVNSYESMPEVFRYAWFSPGTASVQPPMMLGLISSQLTNNEGTALTVLGDWYSNFEPNEKIKQL